MWLSLQVIRNNVSLIMFFVRFLSIVYRENRSKINDWKITQNNKRFSLKNIINFIKLSLYLGFIMYFSVNKVTKLTF